MTATIQPSFQGEHGPPERRVDSGDQSIAGQETIYLPLVAPPGPEATAALSDATARELRELRREMAQLRSDYAALRELLPKQDSGPGCPTGVGATLPVGRIIPASRPPLDDDATRPGVRPGPCSAPGRGSQPGAPARPPSLRPTQPTQPTRPSPAPRPRTAAPTPYRRPSPFAAGPEMPAAVAAVDHTVALPAVQASATARTAALPAVPASERTTALPVIRTSATDSTTALPAVLATDSTTALPTVRTTTTDSATTALRAIPAPRRSSVPAAPTPITSLHPGALPDTPPTTRLPVILPPRPAPPKVLLSPPARTRASSSPEPVTTALAAALAHVLKIQKVAVDGHFFDDLGADSMLMAQFCARVRKHPDLPTVSIKDVYRHPSIAALAEALAPAAPAAPTGPAAGLAAVLAEVLEVEKVAVDGHFFDDLGADSMLMAQFCARVRKHPDLPTVSIKDVYRHTTITALAGAIGGSTPGASAPQATGSAQRSEAARAALSLPDPTTAPMSRSKPRFHLCGLLQLLYLLGLPLLTTSVAAAGFVWVAAAVTPQEIYLRALDFSGASFAAACLLPILLKWTLIGRWKPRQLRVWSLAYFRFWLVKSLVQANPLARFAGSPIFSVYLRLLGAKIGRGVVFLAPTVPVATDLFTAGSGTVIRKDAVITSYRAVDGVIQTGPVTLGRDVYVGEMTVIDIATSMGDGAQLGHSSSLHAGQSVPAGEHWHGSPAEPTTVDYRTVRTTRLSFVRRVVLPLLQVSFMTAVALPLALGLPILVFRQLPQLSALVGPLPPAVTTWGFYQDALLLSTVLFAGLLVFGPLLMVTVPRLLRVLVRPDREYRLYGVRFWALGRITRMTNSRFFVQLFGDSAYIVGYLRSIGYDLSKVVQTGSNFGSAVKHDNPFLSAVGRETVVADGLSFLNADYSSSHFRVSRVTIGAHNFLGNRVAYPAQGRTGDNCLLATKVMVPMDGPLREGVGLLGSPSFEIPRTVDRDHQLDVTDPAELRRKLRRKTWHNTTTILLFLLSRWVLTSLVTVLTLVAVDLHSEFGPAVALSGVALPLLTTGYLILLDLLVRRMMVHRPHGCSIYDRAFRRHERFWKLGADRFPQLFNGTPFKSVVWRLLGATVGRRVFDDGCTFTERRFVTIGDHCTLNAGSIVQCHSQEDGAFKSDRSTIGAGTTLGVGAFVHYGVTIGAGASLGPDSFLMKGSVMAAGSRWGGNPAMELDDPEFDTASEAGREPCDDDRRTALVGGA